MQSCGPTAVYAAVRVMLQEVNEVVVGGRMKEWKKAEVTTIVMWMNG